MTARYEDERNRRASGKRETDKQYADLQREHGEALNRLKDKNFDLQNTAANVVEASDSLKELEQEHIALKRQMVIEEGRAVAKLAEMKKDIQRNEHELENERH